MFVKQLILICVTLVSFYDAYAQLIHSLVTVHLDYCNSILYGLPDNSLYRLQKIDRMNLCISDLRIWMIRNKLKVNDSKTEF